MIQAGVCAAPIATEAAVNSASAQQQEAAEQQGVVLVRRVRRYERAELQPAGRAFCAQRDRTLANGTLNVAQIGASFALQFGFGQVIAHWPRVGDHYPAAAYRAGLLLPLGL